MSISGKADLRDNEHYNLVFSSGVAYYPLGVKSSAYDVIIHEIGFLPKNTGWICPHVYRPYWRLYYNLATGHFLKFGNLTIKLGPEKLVLIPDHQLFSTNGSAKAAPHFWIHFSPRMNYAPDPDIPWQIVPTKGFLETVHSTIDIINNSAEPNRDRLYRLGISLVQHALSQSGIKWKTELPEKLKQLCKYIESNLQKNLTNRHLADFSFLSVDSVAILFRNHFGIPPATWVRQTRVHRVSELLSADELSIEEIAEQTGYKNRFHMSRIFKDCTGMSPGEYRTKFSIVK